MRHFNFQEILCISILIFYLIGIVRDILKNQWKNKGFATSILVAIVALTMIFIVAPAFVVGESMNPTLESKQIVALNKLNRTFEVGDIVVLHSKGLGKNLIKRIVAGPGDTISMRQGAVYVNSKIVQERYETIPTYEDFPEVTVPNDCYFVMGDNRANSLDSRSANVGFIEEKYLNGKVIQ